MMMSEDRNYYDRLELTPDATGAEIREAYLRIKNAYRKDSVALYTLISDSETEELLKNIEEAYQVLSNPDRRREYDRRHGLMTFDAQNPEPAKVISIDRVPPMESQDDADLLVAPTTDFSRDQGRPSKRTPVKPGTMIYEPSEESSSFLDGPESSPQAEVPQTPAPASVESIKHPQDSFGLHALADEIRDEKEWRGAFLRKIREARAIPLEEISAFTKVSKTYLHAIEEENFARLPAAVFLRGFVTQLAKYLKLPHDAVVKAYMARFTKTR